MKLLWTFGAALAFLLALHVTSGFVAPNIVRRCVNSTGVNATELALFYATDFMIITTPVKCYIGCLFETAGFVSNGRLSEDVLYLGKDHSEAEKLKQMIDKCDSSAVQGECEANFEAFKCWMINKDKKGNK